MDSAESSSSSSSYESDHDADPDYRPNSDSSAFSSSSEQGTNETVSDIEDIVASGVLLPQHAFSLQIVSKPKSNSKIWDHFGYLRYKKVAVSKVSNRIFCKECFDTGHLKR